MGEVLNADADVITQAVLRRLAGRGLDAQEIGRAYDDVVTLPLELVRLVAEHPVELLHRRGHRVGMGNPGAVESVCRFALLVVAHLAERGLVDLWVLAAR